MKTFHYPQVESDVQKSSGPIWDQNKRADFPKNSVHRVLSTSEKCGPHLISYIGCKKNKTKPKTDCRFNYGDLRLSKTEMSV